MRILHVLSTGKYSGAENVACQIIKMFEHDSDYDMAYCSLDGPIRSVLDEKGISFYPIAQMNTKEIRRVILEYRPDIIHAHDMRASFVTSRVNGKTRLLSHIHNNAYDSRGISKKSIAYFFVAKKASHIIWVSDSAFEGYVFHRFFKKKSTILYNVLDRQQLNRQMEQDNNQYDFDIAFIGSLIYPKNVQRLLRILRLACDQLPDLKTAIVGSGDEETEVKELSHSLKLDRNVTFMGYMSNPLKLLSDSKIMVLTSRWEGTPMVALEAMALGVPIISTSVDGMKRLVINGENGFLTDDDNEFASCIVRLLTDNQLREELRNNQVRKSIIATDVDGYKQTITEIYQ